MTIDRFVLGVRQVVQQPPSQSQIQAPPPPQIGRVRKRQRVVEQMLMGPGSTTTRNPSRPTSSIVIQELQTQVGPSVASSSQAVQAWKPKFLLDSKLLPANAYVRMWRKVKGAALPKLWRRASFYPMTCTPSKKGRRSPWGEGYSGILSR